MSRQSTDLDLLLLDADALEPELASELRARIAADPRLAQRLAELRLLADPELPPRQAWRIPPPGLGLTAQVALSAAMGPQRVRVGHAFQLCVPAIEDPARAGVVVLRDEGGGWLVAVPPHPDQVRCLGDVARRDGDSLCIDLVARPPAGRQRWALALPALPVHVAPGDDPWAVLRSEIAARRVPVGAVEVEVVPR